MVSAKHGCHTHQAIPSTPKTTQLLLLTRQSTWNRTSRYESPRSLQPFLSSRISPYPLSTLHPCPLPRSTIFQFPPLLHPSPIHPFESPPHATCPPPPFSSPTHPGAPLVTHLLWITSLRCFGGAFWKSKLTTDGVCYVVVKLADWVLGGFLVSVAIPTTQEAAQAHAGAQPKHAEQDANAEE